MVSIVRRGSAPRRGIIAAVRAKTANHQRRPHEVVVLAYDGLGLFEFSAACEAFTTAATLASERPWYRLSVCSLGGAAVVASNGLRIDGLAAIERRRLVDTIIVAPCDDPAGAPAEVLSWLVQQHARGARLVSLCTGAFVLAAAGLLAGRRVTTHWTDCAALARRHPEVVVDPNVLYVDDGDILTAAGSAASIDLCLHVIRHDLGAEVANRVARDMVVAPYRDGGQAQYIDAPVPDREGSDLFVDTMKWMRSHLDQALTVDDLARRSAMSRRNFARRFAAATGSTPYQWLLRQRLQQAQRLLETSDLPVEAVAEHSGFGNATNLRKHFGQHVRTTPLAYRHAFRARVD
jgi:AraC family transcriptional activator FtrA